LRAEVERITELNDRLSRMLSAYAERMEAARRELLATGWDAAVAAMRYEDGSPIEVSVNVNPYRQPLADLSLPA
jgi:hypothetical protein